MVGPLRRCLTGPEHTSGSDEFIDREVTQTDGEEAGSRQVERRLHSDSALNLSHVDKSLGTF